MGGGEGGLDEVEISGFEAEELINFSGGWGEKGKDLFGLLAVRGLGVAGEDGEDVDSGLGGD